MNGRRLIVGARPAMPRVLWGARLYAATRRAGLAAAGCLVAAVVLVVARSTVLHVPFAPELVVIEAVLVAPVLPVLVVGVTLTAPLAAVEDVARETLRRLRAVHAGVLVVLVGALSLLIARPGALEQLSVLRNAALLLGALLVTAVLVDAHSAWLGALLPAMACFFFGKSHDDGSIRAWALLLRLPDGTSLAVAVAVLAAGTVLFVVRGPVRADD